MMNMATPVTTQNITISIDAVDETNDEYIASVEKIEKKQNNGNEEHTGDGKNLLNPMRSPSSSVSSGNSQSSHHNWLTRLRGRFESNASETKAPKKKFMSGMMKRGRTVRRRCIRDINSVVPPGEADKGRRGLVTMSSEQRLRMFVLREILDTEKDYVQLLEFIVTRLKKDIDKVASKKVSPICTVKVVSQFLGNLDEIYQVHVEFLRQLKAATSPFPYYTNIIGDVFLQFKEKFRLYDEYCTNFSVAQKIGYELERDPILKDTIELILFLTYDAMALGIISKHLQAWKVDVATDKRSFVRLEGFIICPVQRLCKYPLLLRELKKRTPENHQDFKNVDNALKLMEEVTSSVNEAQKKAIVVQGIRDLENVYDNWERSGNLSKVGFLTKLGGITNRRWFIRWFTLNGFKLSYYAEPTDQKPLGVLDLTSYVSIQDNCDEEARRSFAFSIAMPKRVHYMYAISEEDKRDWLDILHWKMTCIDRSREQSGKPMETMVISAFASILRPKMNSLALAGENINENHSFVADDHERAREEIESTKKDETVEKPKFNNRAMNLLRRTFRRKHRYSLNTTDEAHVSTEDKAT